MMFHVSIRRPEDEHRVCCLGAVMRDRCTCWVTEHDREQAKPRPGPVQVQPRMCGDCACRPGSVEETDPDSMASSVQGVQSLAEQGAPFYCHQGMRQRTGKVHPDGERIEFDGPRPADNYDPPIHDGVPYQASGEPALICAGWLAKNRAAKALTYPQARRLLGRLPAAYSKGRRLVLKGVAIVYADTGEDY